MSDAREPFFSIVIPTFARPRPLAACLQSITELDYNRSSFEVLVVDDGSPTPLSDIVRPFEATIDIRVFRQENAGPAAARNAGANHARGDWLVFVDDDCAPARDYLAALAARSLTATDCAIGGRTVNVLTGNVYSAASQLLNDYLYGHYNADPDHARFLASNNLAVPTHLFQQLGGFDAVFTRAAFEDRDLCERLLRAGHRIVYAREMVMRHAHAMTLRKYWRQHFTYGRGAASFHRSRGSGSNGADADFERASFYVNLLRYPLSRRDEAPALAMLALFFLSQVAMTAGFAREHLDQRVGRRPAV